MVFPSLPVYLDTPNWQQQFPNQQGQVEVGHENPQLPPLPPLPPHVPCGPTNSGSIRPGSLAERARLANIPQPEPGLKCPRCESTNTKFCYFNNYSLTQPRHFCKTCRRYWTRGGALRNVPVGGGCRRNKKSKSNQSNTSSTIASTSSSEGSRSITSTSPIPCNIMTHNLPQLHLNQVPFKTSLNNLGQFGVENIGFNFGGVGISGQTNVGLMNNAILSSRGSQNVPFFDPTQATTTGLLPFHHQSGGASDGSPSNTNSRVSEQVAPVKMEESQGLNLSRQLLGVSENTQYWLGGGNTWTDLPSINSSSTSHLE